MRVIPLSNSYYFAIVDDEDYERVIKYNWYAKKNGHCWYAASSRFGGGAGVISLHRYVLELDPDEQPDHKNRCGLDCRRSNLRISTQQQNVCNAVKPQGPNGSGYRGVIKNRTKWTARIKLEGHLKHLGTYATPEEAGRVYDAAARELHGEYAVLNFDAQEAI